MVSTDKVTPSRSRISRERRFDLRPIHRETLRGQVAQEDVLRNGQVFGQVELLVDRRDAQGLGILGPPDVHRLPFEEDLAFILGVRAGQDLDQGRLAGPVLAQQGMDLAFPDGEADAFQRLDAGEGFADALHFQQDFTWGWTHGGLLYGYLPRWER